MLLLSTVASTVLAVAAQGPPAPPTTRPAVWTLVAAGPTNDGLAIDPEGRLFAGCNGTDGLPDGDTIYRVDPDGKLTPFATGLSPWPVGLGFDAEGFLYASSWNAGQVLRIDPEGKAAVFATGIPGPAGLAVVSERELYVASWSANAVVGLDGEGRLVRRLAGSSLLGPSGLTHDRASGALYACNWADGRITRIPTNGEPELFTTLPTPAGTGCAALAILEGKLYATAYAAHRIFEVDLKTAAVRVLAGDGQAGRVDGRLESARFDGPTGLVASPAERRLYVSQEPNAPQQGSGGVGGLRVIELGREEAAPTTPEQATEEAVRESQGLDLGTLAPSRYFDFLVGNWTVTAGAGSWTTTVRRELMGQMLVMESTGARTQFVYTPDENLWKATFFSPLGDHDVLVGGLQGNGLALDQTVVRGRPGLIGRTTFYDVRADAFCSDFLVSADGGESWTADFHSCYERVPDPEAPRPERTGEAAAFDFLLGDWDVRMEVRQPDGSLARARGWCRGRFDPELGGVREELEVLFESWSSYRSTHLRRFDAGTERWAVERTSDHAPLPLSLEVSRGDDGSLQELVRDSGGRLTERLVYERRAEGHYRIRADQLNGEGRVLRAGVWTLDARRTRPLVTAGPRESAAR